MGKKIKIQIRDEHPGSYFRELIETIFCVKILKFFDADPDPGSGFFLTRVRDGKNSDPGFGIRGKHPGSATLLMLVLLTV